MGKRVYCNSKTSACQVLLGSSKKIQACIKLNILLIPLPHTQKKAAQLYTPLKLLSLHVVPLGCTCANMDIYVRHTYF